MNEILKIEIHFQGKCIFSSICNEKKLKGATIRVENIALFGIVTNSYDNFILYIWQKEKEIKK